MLLATFCCSKCGILTKGFFPRQDWGILNFWLNYNEFLFPFFVFMWDKFLLMYCFNKSSYSLFDLWVMTSFLCPLFWLIRASAWKEMTNSHHVLTSISVLFSFLLCISNKFSNRKVFVNDAWKMLWGWRNGEKQS